MFSCQSYKMCYLVSVKFGSEFSFALNILAWLLSVFRYGFGILFLAVVNPPLSLFLGSGGSTTKT